MTGVEGEAGEEAAEGGFPPINYRDAGPGSRTFAIRKRGEPLRFETRLVPSLDTCLRPQREPEGNGAAHAIEARGKCT